MLTARGDENTKETRSSEHNITDTHVNSQLLWQHAPGPHGSVLDEVLELREGGMCPTASPIDNHLQMKN